jgi:hypothetical protein
MDDLKCFFYSGFTLEYTISSNKWSFSEVPQFEASRDEYIAHATYCLSRCKQMEQLITKNSSNGDDFPQIFGYRRRRTITTSSSGISGSSSPMHLSTGSMPSYMTTSARSTSTVDSMSSKYFALLKIMFFSA